MIKAIIFDADGVVLQKRDKYFSERLVEDYALKILKAEVLEFFKNEYKQCVVGRMDLEKAISRYLPQWGWQKSTKELFNYWFSYENKINQDVLGLIKELKSRDIKCYLASDHTKYRANDLMNNLGLVDYFDGAFFSCDLGHTKNEKEFWQEVITKLNLKPQETMFLDDEEENVQVAAQIGIKSFIFQGTQKTKELLK